MKKVIAFICSLFISFLLIIGIKEYYAYKIHFNYYDKVAEILTDSKFKSLTLQRESILRGDNLLMFGSSEFESGRKYFSHPFKFYNDKNDGFQVNLIGKAGYKSLVHAIDFGALGENLKNQKVVFVLSPQWFIKGGIDANTLEANSSELQIDEFLLNPSITSKEKEYLAERIVKVTSKNSNPDFQTMINLCKLYSKQDLQTKALKFILTPYYYARYQLLSIKDELNSYNIIKNNQTQRFVSYKFPSKTNFDWQKELSKASYDASINSNNSFGIDNNSLRVMTKGNLEKFKNSMKKISYDNSPEYEDFKLLLDICKTEGIKPLIINIPVNGMWYDYCGFNKDDRQIYYNKVNSMIKAYGFQCADFSNHEYDNYFLHDGTHLGLKGWIYVDKAINQYYHQNK